MNLRHRKTLRHRAAERGVTLIIALIMLVAMSLLAVWAYNTSTTNLRTVHNTQSRQEAFSAAQTAIESTISSSLFMQDPAAMAASPIPVDIDGDGTADYTARLAPAPACYRARTVAATELNPALATDLPCLVSQEPSGIDSDVPGAAAGGSLCVDMEWNVRAVVSDAATATNVAVNQGIAVRGLVTDAASGCP